MECKKNKKEIKNMAVLTAKCEKAFIVSPENSKKFIEYKGDSRAKEKTKETLSKITIKETANEKR